MKTHIELITNLKGLIRVINPKFTNDNSNSDQYLLCEIKSLLEMSKLNTENSVNHVDEYYEQKKFQE